LNRPPDILCISSIDWDHIWQGHQEIMSMLVADGHRVLFVENTGVRGPSVGDLPRIRKRIMSWWRATKGFREERPNLFLYSPLLLPFPYSRIARWINKTFMLRALRRWMNVTGFHRPIVWTFLPTPLSLDLIKGIDSQLTVYYCIDDLATSSPGARRIVPSEERLFKQADLVFVTSEKLRERAARFNQRVHLFPFGVSYDRFAQARAEGTPPPADIAALKKPIAGYVGGLHQWIDQDLMKQVMERLPDVTFAFVGPPQTDLSLIESSPNIRLLGQKPHAALPEYIGGFDVGLVPYKLSEYTNNVYPTKLNEYLAMGKPVVATDIPEILRFNKDHGDIIRIASGPDAFASAIRDAIAERAPAAVDRRYAVAQSNSWRSRLSAMVALIDEGIARRDAGDQRWDAALKRVYRAARGHTTRIVLGIAAVYVLVFYTNVLWWAAQPLLVSRPPEIADAVVVFAGGVGESGKAGGGHLERLKQAVDLYKAGYVPTIVLSSGYVSSLKEAEVMRALAIDQGVPPRSIILEEKAKDTHENVVFVDQIVKQHQWRKILLVSSPYHMRRAARVWNKLAPEVTVIPTPPSSSQFYEHGTGASLEQVRGILWEYAAIAYYWWQGWA
jgi:uncharacterized SAM-binding protein YcdF (DUF218 family)/glycosyltransferase involved in cell wall biosynthesis